MDNPHVSEFLKSLEDWVDDRFISRTQIQYLAMFTKYLVNLSDDGGWSYYGHSWKEGHPIGCLVIKATIEGAPVVCFCSARTFLNGVKIFMRKLEDGEEDWRPDKYRT